MSGRHVTGYDEAKDVLADPRFVVPEAPPSPAGLGGLRAAVSRFVNGEVHARRRALVEAELARLDPAALRAGARARTEAVLDAAAGSRIEAMASIARPVPLAVICSGLGVADEDLDAAVADAILVGAAYIPGTADERVDAAADRLAGRLARGDDEGTAAAVAVLAQACEATAGLIGNALARAAESSEADVEAVLADTVRFAPPLRPARRVGPDGGEVTVDLAAANRDGGEAAPDLTFGTGIRPCPGRREALALATGVLEALLPRCTVAQPVSYDDPSGLPMPRRLELEEKR